MEESIRQFVRDRALACCEYCQTPEAASGPLPFHVEHIRSRQHRGSDSLDNLCWACSRCNYFKGPNVSSYDPETDQLVRLFDPRHDHWDNHFRREGPVIVGVTSEGRATVELLQFNDERRVELRMILEE